MRIRIAMLTHIMAKVLTTTTIQPNAADTGAHEEVCQRITVAFMQYDHMHREGDATSISIMCFHLHRPQVCGSSLLCRNNRLQSSHRVDVSVNRVSSGQD